MSSVGGIKSTHFEGNLKSAGRIGRILCGMVFHEGSNKLGRSMMSMG